jgi:hypothetical protein
MRTAAAIERPQFTRARRRHTTTEEVMQAGIFCGSAARLFARQLHANAALQQERGCVFCAAGSMSRLYKGDSLKKVFSVMSVPRKYKRVEFRSWSCRSTEEYRRVQVASGR